jgi:hypothetical protein
LRKIGVIGRILRRAIGELKASPNPKILLGFRIAFEK